MAGKSKRSRSEKATSHSAAVTTAKMAAAIAKRTEKRRVREVSDDEPEEMRDIDDEVADQSSDEAPEDSDDSDPEEGGEEGGDDGDDRVDFSTLLGVGDSDHDVEEDLEVMALSNLPSQIVTDVRNDEAALDKKLADVELFSRLKDKRKKSLFWESLSITVPLEDKFEDKLAVDDLEREKKFAEMATAATHIGLERLRSKKVKFRRPSDYFAEMTKTDNQMSKVKARILHQKEKIDSAQTRRHNRDLAKNKKKVRSEQVEKEQGRKKKAKDEIETIHRLRKQRLKQRAEGGGDENSGDDEFPIDLLEVEQLDDERKFQSQKDIASGKRKAWSGNDMSGIRVKEPKVGQRGTQNDGRGGRGQVRRGGSRMGPYGGVKKAQGSKKRLGKSRRSQK